MEKQEGVRYSALVPNLKGLENAIAAGAKHVAVFAAASETFSQKNINCSIAESLKRFRKVCTHAHSNGVKVRGYMSVVFGCPYEGRIDPNEVAKLACELIDMGCYEVSLSDTIGVATPNEVADVLQSVSSQVPVSKLAVHKQTSLKSTSSTFQSLVLTR